MFFLIIDVSKFLRLISKSWWQISSERANRYYIAPTIRKYDSKLIEHAETRATSMTQLPEMEMEVTQVAIVTRGGKKKDRRDRFICVTAITFRAPSSSLDYARRPIAYPRPGGEIWTPREGSRYVRVHYGEWIQQRRFPSKASVPSLSRSFARASNTDILRIRQGRKFSLYTVLIVAPSRVFVFFISAYVSIATTRDARTPPVCWNVVR